MITLHPIASDLELYVMGALDPVTASRVEAHIADCEACASALAHEAALEMAFEQIARAPETSVKLVAQKRDAAAKAGSMHRRTVSIACALGGALSIAAAWILWVSPVPPDAVRVLGAPTYDVGADAESGSSNTTASLDAMRSAGLDGG
jgi:anti-sigma factor RsiW